MEQPITEKNDASNIPGNLPGAEDQAARVEQAGGLTEEQAEDIFREQTQQPIPSGPATPGKGEDTVLFVETINIPEQALEGSPEDLIPGSAPEAMILAGADLEVGVPWYRSRWMYVGTGLLAATALSIGGVLLIRGLNQRKRQQAISRNIIKPIKQFRKRRAFFQLPSRMKDRVGGWAAQLSGPASRLIGQAQGPVQRLTNRAQGGVATLKPLQSRGSAQGMMSRTRRQLAQRFSPVSEQFGALRATTRTRATQAIKGAQENLAQLGKGMAAGVEETGERLKHGWKLGRNFALGAVTGAVWAALFAQQSGEITRQRLAQTFQARRRKE